MVLVLCRCLPVCGLICGMGSISSARTLSRRAAGLEADVGRGTGSLIPSKVPAHDWDETKQKEDLDPTVVPVLKLVKWLERTSVRILTENTGRYSLS